MTNIDDILSETYFLQPRLFMLQATFSEKPVKRAYLNERWSSSLEIDMKVS